MNEAAPPLDTVPVVILNWNGLEDTLACVASLKAQEGVRAQVHVVDNGSEGGEAEALAGSLGEGIRLHASPVNLGFTGGCNLALRGLLEQGDAPFVALLNNDAVADPRWLATLLEAARLHPRAGMFASRMVFFDDPGTIENAGILLLSSLDALPRGRGRPVADFGREEAVLGACAGACLYRTAMLREVGLFREDFFVNFEDLELALRAQVMGWPCRYVPGAVVRHRLNRSVTRARNGEFSSRSLRNVALACLANLPWQVLALNLPWAALRTLLLCAGPGPSRRHMREALRMLWRERGAIRAHRREIAPLRRAPWWRIWRMQRSFLRGFPEYLRRRGARAVSG